jgi:hypothetical protein
LELQPYINKVRAMRRDLAMHAIKQQEEAENGLLIVQVTLSQSEQCHMFVDTAASVVTITPELVEVLALSDKIGDEVEVTLAGGIRIKAPQLALPIMTVYGMTAEYIKALVLKESHVGVDGCIGLSFLNRFDYVIEKERPQRLSLKEIEKLPSNASDGADAPAFDVFICHKSDDFHYAETVYEELTRRGYKPFLSEKSISSEFQKAIYSALDDAKHLIVVGSSRKNVESRWVEAEWHLFLQQLRMGKKKGNIINVMCENMVVDDLPLPLSVYQSISIKDPSWKATLVSFLPK